MNYSEEHVKQVLEAFLEGSRLDFKDEQSNGQYDFDLTYNDGKTAALEVTRAIDETWLETSTAIRNKKKGGSTFKATKCMQSWHIFVTQHSNINKIRKYADEYLADLEIAGVISFSFPSRDPKVQQICGDLGVTGGCVLDSNSEPTISIGGPLGGGAVGASLAIKAGEKKASEDDNRKKLNKAASEERHLAVYMDGGNPSVWNALTCGAFAPPNYPPNLPEEITHIWLIGSPDTKRPNTFTIWYASKGNNWQSSEVVLHQPSQATSVADNLTPSA